MDLKAYLLNNLFWQAILALVDNNSKSCLAIGLLNLFNSFSLFLEPCINLLLKVSRSLFYAKRLNLALFVKKDCWRLLLAKMACLARIFPTSLWLLT